MQWSLTSYCIVNPWRIFLMEFNAIVLLFYSFWFMRGWVAIVSFSRRSTMHRVCRNSIYCKWPANLKDWNSILHRSGARWVRRLNFNIISILCQFNYYCRHIYLLQKEICFIKCQKSPLGVKIGNILIGVMNEIGDFILVINKCVFFLKYFLSWQMLS